MTPTRLRSRFGVTRKLIARTVREIARRFRPRRITLFGSYAAGTPHADSDVDLLIVADTRRPMALAARILRTVGGRFPMDVLVRTPREMRRRLDLPDPFLIAILKQGRVLYEARRARVG